MAEWQLLPHTHTNTFKFGVFGLKNVPQFFNIFLPYFLHLLILSQTGCSFAGNFATLIWSSINQSINQSINSDIIVSYAIIVCNHRILGLPLLSAFRSNLAQTISPATQATSIFAIIASSHQSLQLRSSTNFYQVSKCSSNANLANLISAFSNRRADTNLSVLIRKAIHLFADPCNLIS